MKTIKQASQCYAGINDDKSSNLAIVYDKYDLAISFISGIEFAQRWISVEEELPIGVWIIVKHDIIDSYGVCRIAGKIDYNFVKSTFTHWRPINLE